MGAFRDGGGLSPSIVAWREELRVQRRATWIVVTHRGLVGLRTYWHEFCVNGRDTLALLPGCVVTPQRANQRGGVVMRRRANYTVGRTPVGRNSVWAAQPWALRDTNLLRPHGGYDFL